MTGIHILRRISQIAIHKHATPTTAINSLFCWNGRRRDQREHFARRFCQMTSLDTEKNLLEKKQTQEWREIELEVSMLRHRGGRVPTKLTDANIITLLKKNYYSRVSYLNFLFLKELQELNGRRKKKERAEDLKAFAEEKDQRKEELKRKGIIEISYDIYNGVVPRIGKTTENKYGVGRLRHARMFGQSLLLDMSYVPHMSERELENLYKQLQMSVSKNKEDLDPFDLRIVNALNHDKERKYLDKTFPDWIRNDKMLEITNDSYLDLFDRSKLVYLTPHCDTELLDFDHEAVYIIGCFVDTRGQGPISRSIAKKDGIKMRKLPLDRFMNFSGKFVKRNLSLPIVMNSLLTVKNTGSWDNAFAVKPYLHNMRRKQMKKH